MRYQLLTLIAEVARVTALPMAQCSSTYFFTLYEMMATTPCAKDKQAHSASGDSYTMTSFDIYGEQPSASDPMGNPTLGEST